ncbi:hypothetical protein AQUCO_08600015v1 [Aquilegia coerulea]|uniref:Cytochrome P450 n=1 Tax=Aquilegia coerulea TaxID=218851 RepID=A0A2G5C6G2_AQUCA|nr:hypothetical protein AQUCO_08600008v1 [Aquilegia coerulea]PIA26859.1 hypothetical protein AQUCO_08600015v1 [Aquilegia coerulea]
MEEVVLSLVIVFSSLVFTLVYRVLNWVWLEPRKLEKHLRKQGIPGPPYKMLQGNMKEIASLLLKVRSNPMEHSHRIVRRILPYIHQTVENYGKTFVIWYGPSPRLTIMDPKLIRDILSDKSGQFGKVKQGPIFKYLFDGLVNYEGEKWIKHRKIINPAFHQEKLKMMLPEFYSSCSELIGKWQTMVSDGSCEIDVWPDLQNFSADVISRTAFGSSYEEGRRIFQLQTEQSELVMSMFRYLIIPGFRFLPTKKNRRMNEIYREVNKLLKDIIKKRENAIKLGEASKDDLLGMLLESNMNEINAGGNKNVGMSIDDVIQECKLFYFAGQETTSTMIVWTMILLSMHPEWEEKAREEVLLVFGKNKPDYEGLCQLKIVTMILHEVLRLYPSVVMLLRATHKRVNLGEMDLPAGLTLSMPTLLITHDREIWGEDAEEFNPERFSEGISKATKNQVTFFPFGWGHRICIGQTFAILEAKMALAMILQNFSFELSGRYVHAPYSVITLQPQHGAQLILTKI